MPREVSAEDELSLAEYRRMDPVVVRCHSCHESLTVEYDQVWCHLCKGELYPRDPNEGNPDRIDIEPGQSYPKGG